MEKIRLHSKKYHLIDKIDCLGFNALYLRELKGILVKEQKINQELKDEVNKMSNVINLKIISKQLDNINLTTKKQLDRLNSVRFGFLRKYSYRRFKNACREEVEQSKFFSKILKETMTDSKGLETIEEEIEKENLLIKQAQQAYNELVKSAGNVKKVQQKAKELLLISNRLKKTKLYGYVRSDVEYIIGKAAYAMKHPKESKLKCALAGAYIIAPLTFEMTGVYLFFRYMNRYIKEARLGKKGDNAA